MRDPQSISVNEDERMIPVWSIVVASLAFVLVEYYFWVIAPEQRHHAPPPLGFRIYFNLSWGVVASLYFLMVGYISKDAPRRGMSTRFWMLICFVMPGGHWRRALLSAAPAGSFALPGLRHACAERLPLLPAVQLPAHGQLRQLLPHRPRHRPVLHALRPRAGRGPHAGAAAG